MKPGKKISRLLNLILTVVLLAFAYGYISDIVDQTDFSTVSVRWPLLLLSAALSVLYYILMSLNWWFSGRILQGSATRRQTLAFLASQPYKYLPSSFFTFSSRAVYGKKLGLTLKQSSIAQIFENSSLLGANFVLFVFLYLAATSPIYSLLLFMLASVLVLIIYYRYPLIHIRFRGRQLNIAVPHLLKMYWLATLGWIFSGLSFVVLNLALGFPVSFLEFLAGNTIAFSLSILAVFAPGGIGVREVVYNFFAVGGAVIIYWRIMLFVLDFILGITAMALIRKTKTDD